MSTLAVTRQEVRLPKQPVKEQMSAINWRSTPKQLRQLNQANTNGSVVVVCPNIRPEQFALQAQSFGIRLGSDEYCPGAWNQLHDSVDLGHGSPMLAWRVKPLASINQSWNQARKQHQIYNQSTGQTAMARGLPVTVAAMLLNFWPNFPTDAMIGCPGSRRGKETFPVLTKSQADGQTQIKIIACIGDDDNAEGLIIPIQLDCVPCS